MSTANSSILVTAGTGETVAMQSAGGKKYEVVVPAYASGQLHGDISTFFVETGSVALAGSKHHLTLANASGSTVTVRLMAIVVVNLDTTATAGAFSGMWTVQIRRAPSAMPTGGTSLT